jgi:hypothetical protein
VKRLHTFAHRERPFATLLKERFAAEGIVCLVRNDELSTALGEIPFLECYPELWVVDDDVYPRARLLLDQWLGEMATEQAGWRCSGCGERMEGQFEACWQCGKEKNNDSRGRMTDDG